MGEKLHQPPICPPIPSMDSDSDSDASHISATPPQSPAAAAAAAPPPPRPPPPKSKVRVAPLPSNQKSKPRSTPKPSDPPPPSLPFPAPDLSILHGISLVKIHRPSAPTTATTSSFSSLVRSRKPSFSPSDFHNPEPPPPPPVPTTVVPSRPTAPPARPAKIHPNWIGPDVPVQTQPKRPKFSSEGNFVRLNINGHGRKYGYRNSKRGGSSSSSSYASSRGRRYRRKTVGDTTSQGEKSAGTCAVEVVVEEEDGLDGACEQRRKTKCGDEVIEAAVVSAREEPTDENLEHLLKLVHGYDSFRDGQLETIKRVLAGESMMLVLPTGAGKSLCYQLPALLLPGLTLVVSPLVALMVDQLRQLPPVIPGGLLSSSQTSEETSTTLQRLREGSIKVLFVSPERFLNAEFLCIFGDTLSISLVVIDEAHCISEWSHNFRPSFLRLRASDLRAKLKVNCFLAMTATATTQTLHDIMNSLEIPPSNLIHTCQIRRNLQLSVTLSENRLKDVLSLMKFPPFVEMRSIIIYCKFQAETDLVSKYLSDNNIPAKAYHSGILANKRNRVQELFCSNKIRVVVATVAFGMGLDKSDVEAVINYSLPESLEEYIQETGRAGRDGRLSYCHLLFDYTTYFRLRSLLYSDGVDEYAISKLLSHIFSSNIYAGEICSLVKESASRKFDMKEEVLLTILTQLEMGDVQYLRLLPQINITCTLYFHKTPPSSLANKDLLIAAILKKSESKQGHYVFDIPTVANHAEITTTRLQNQLQNLKSLGEITYEVKDPAFCFMIMKKPDDVCSLTASLTKWLSEVECCKVGKLDAMFHVANFAVKECKRVDGCTDSMHTPCIQKKILDYFCRDHNAPCDNYDINLSRNSRFLHADIKVFLQSNLNAKFTPRAVARILHGIPSPAFPYSTWSKTHFWGRYMELEFPTVMEAATTELMNFVRKGGV